MIEELRRLLYTLWLILPAYTANGSPVVGVKILNRIGVNRHPIDGGRSFIDGRRIFGDNKTWEGFFIGVFTGVLTGFIQMILVDGGSVYITRSVALSLGAMTGDLLGAFIKRRLGLKPGDPLPFLDQTMFLFIAILTAVAFKVMCVDLVETLFLTAITVLLHIATNRLAYALKLKDIPW